MQILKFLLRDAVRIKPQKKRFFNYWRKMDAYLTENNWRMMYKKRVCCLCLGLQFAGNNFVLTFMNIRDLLAYQMFQNLNAKRLKLNPFYTNQCS